MLINIPRRNFAPGSEFVSAAVVSLPDEKMLKVSLDIDEALQLDPNFYFRIDFELSQDGFLTVFKGSGAEFTGDPRKAGYPPDYIRPNLPPPNWQIRARVSNLGQATVRVGFIVESQVGTRRSISRG